MEEETECMEFRTQSVSQVILQKLGMPWRYHGARKALAKMYAAVRGPVLFSLSKDRKGKTGDK